jgi:monoamine oxidase
MSPHGESARDPLRPPARSWAAESPFVGESTEEEQAPIHPWYRGYTPFVEGQKELYGPEAEWGSDLTALEPEELGEELVTEKLPLQRPSWQPLSLPRACQEKLKNTKKPSVAVVGGGLAGLMAARWLGQQGIEVTVFEARSQWGGRVLSNKSFSNGRITEEGAELVGSFHTAWLALARKYGLAVVSRMDNDLYERAGLDVKLTLDQKLPVDEIRKLDEHMEKWVLEPIARLAGQIRDPAQPWLEPWLDKYDKMSVADALVQLYGVKRDERLWKAIEFKLVNDEVAPLDRMNFLGLLCKVRGGQNARFGSDDTDDLKERLMKLCMRHWKHADGCQRLATEMAEEERMKRRLMRYWTELEIFRCADGCQTLATRMADEIKAEYGAKLHRGVAVTHINLSQQGVKLGFKQVVDERKEKLADGLPQFISRDYVILAIPPSVWAGMTITETAGGKTRTVNLDQEVGAMGMDPAIKCFSDVKKRFWIEEKPPAAPYGGSSALGQVWEGTDNQARVGNQGIVLSVFAGPIIRTPLVPGKAAHRVPTKGECKRELRNLYPGYTDENLNKKEPLFRDWPTEPFIKTGYYSPRTGEIFKIGPKLRDPFLDRLIFAGEHTQLDFFGYMEGALRSGERAAHTLILQACGMWQKSAPTSSKPPVITAGARSASEHETLSGDHSSTSYPEEAESAFLPQGSFVGDSEEERNQRGAQPVAQSPVLGTLEDRQDSFDAVQPEGVRAQNQLEGKENWGELEETFQTNPEESLGEDEAELESLEDLESSYFQEHDSREELARLKETEGAAPHERLYFEYDVPALGSAKNDHPLREIADGQRGKLPDDILAAILTRGESNANDLTNRVFWQKHRDPSDKKLDPNDPKQKALRDEWAMILRRQVEPVIWLRQIIDQLDRHRGDIPREFLLGWMAAESDGRISTVSTLGERGYFQIMWQSGEAKEQLGLTREAFLRLSTDREFSVEKGIQLAETYRQHFLRKYPALPDGSDLLWRLTKGRHALPGALDKVLDGLVKAGTTITWQAVSRSLPKMASSVDLTLDFATRLKPLADLVPAPPATTPELYTESSPWVPKSGYEDRVSEAAAEQATEENLAQFDEQVSASGARAVVRAMQQSLNKWRVEIGQTPIKEDGLLSAETKNAILEFQKASGLKGQDGIAGPATRERLALLLDILKNIPTSPVFIENRSRLFGLVGGAGFRSLEGPTQTEVLKRILSYQVPGTLDNISHLTNLVTQTGFELLPKASQKLMLRVLAARPDDAPLVDNLGQLAGSAAFRSLEEPIQTWVLKRIQSYAGNRGKIDNLENLITATRNFDRLPKESRNVMLVALANHPNDARLVDNFRRVVEGTFASMAAGIDFLQLDQPTQADVLNRVVAYPRNPRHVDNLMSLVTTSGFGNLASDVRAQVLDGLPSRFGTVVLNGPFNVNNNPPTNIGNMMSLVTALGFEKLRPEVRDLMLDVQASRPDNDQLASALGSLASGPRLRQDSKTARQTVLQVADSIP